MWYVSLKLYNIVFNSLSNLLLTDPIYIICYLTLYTFCFYCLSECKEINLVTYDIIIRFPHSLEDLSGNSLIL